MSPRWLSHLALDAWQIDLARAHGGALGRRDSAALAQVLAAPMARHAATPDASLMELAALYGVALLRHAPYRSGNNALALLSMFAFLQINGVKFVDSIHGAEVPLFATPSISETGIRTWLESCVAERART